MELYISSFIFSMMLMASNVFGSVVEPENSHFEILKTVGGDQTDYRVVEKTNQLPNDVGPISTQILERHPRMSFIGTINSKSFYVERSKVSWTTANNACQEIGMKLARFDVDAEKDFVYSALPSSDGRVWIGARLNFDGRPDFRWSDNNAGVSYSSFVYYPNAQAVMSLIVSVSDGHPNWYLVQLQSELNFYVCFV